MKGYDIFSETLRGLSLLPIFGNPGTTELSSLRHLDDYVLTLLDGLSVGMADGFSQFSGNPSLVNLHSIPGLGNSMGFIYTAKINRTPLIVTAGQQDQRHLLMEPLLSGDFISFVGNNFKFKYELNSVSEIQGALKKAKMIAATPPTGPVFLSIPMNIMDEEGVFEQTEDVRTDINISNEGLAEYIASVLNNSTNPALVFGWEVDALNAFEEAEKLAEKLGCPVYSEPLSHRAPFNSDHPLFAGDLLPGSTLINLKLLQNDVVIFLGGDITLYPYLPSPLLKDKKVIFIGLNLQPKFGESYTVNIKAFMRQLTPKVQKKCNFSRPIDLGLATKIANERGSMGINYVLGRVKKYFANYTIVDESISSSTATRAILGYSHKKYFTAKSGQLGWAMPAAAGISMKEKNVLAIIGDGSFMYSIQALWSIMKYNLPVKTIVLNNRGYSILKSYALSYYPDMKEKDFLSFDLDLVSLTKGYGIDVREADKNLEDLKWLREGDSPKVLVVNVDRTIPKLFL